MLRLILIHFLLSSYKETTFSHSYIYCYIILPISINVSRPILRTPAMTEIADAVEDIQAELSPIHTMSSSIQHKRLKRADPQLYEHLKQLEIDPHLYSLRWIRLLLGREFHMEDVLLLWDAIFAQSSVGSNTIPFFLELLCVSMVRCFSFSLHFKSFCLFICFFILKINNNQFCKYIFSYIQIINK